MAVSRRNRRVFCGANGRLEGPFGPVGGRVLSLSRGGAFFQGREQLPVGKSFELAFELPGRGPLHALAEVRYHHRYADGDGMGLCFVRLEADGLRWITAFVAEAPADVRSPGDEGGG